MREERDEGREGCGEGREEREMSSDSLYLALKLK